ncbi:phage tail tape measure protein, partial [Vibrio cholerae]|nr:phage tail tape measure protein [Vibrio cholerae]
TFSDKKKVEFLNRQGIEVFKKGTKELREPVELLLEILDKAKNDPLKLGDVFDQTSLQGLASLYDQEDKDLLRS